MQTEKQTAHKNLNIPEDHKIIISLDGGGMKGIFTLQLLKKLEEVAGSPCYKWCDMVAGTSTGGIIAGFIASGHTATQIDELYNNLVTQVFLKRGPFNGRILNLSKFSKRNYRKLLKEKVQDITLLDCNKKTGIDILLTSKDLKAGEETFFTCFSHDNNHKGTYKDVLLRAALESTMSAPTYFKPLERFIDGGTTTYNNPSMAAVMEAVCYNGKGKYDIDKLTTFSFGTGTALRFINADKGIKFPVPEVKFWLDYVMDESSKDASEMQVDMMRSGLLGKGFQFRRYQVSFNEQIITGKLNINVRSKDLKIDMANTKQFDLMKRIGEATANYICPKEENGMDISLRQGNWFRSDFVDATHKTRGALVSRQGDHYVDEVLNNLNTAHWIDKQKH